MASALPVFPELPPGYHVVVLYRGDSAALDLQAQPLSMLQQFIDEVDVGGGPSHSPDSGSGW